MRANRQKQKKPSEAATSGQCLSRDEAILRMSLECAKAGAWSVQFDPPAMWLSPQMREMCRFSPDEVLSPEKFLGMVHPEDREAVDRAVRRAVETRTEFRIEHRVAEAGGGIRWVEAHGGAYSELPGAPPVVTGISIDITDRKLAEIALRESEERFRAMIEQAPMPIGLSRAGKITHVNRRYLEVFGFGNVDELRGRSVLTQWAPESRKKIQEIGAKHLPIANFIEFDETGLRKNGSQIALHAIATTVRLSDGEAGMVLLRDITQNKLMAEARQKAEEALRESEKRYRLLAENATDVIWTTDLGGSFRYVSPSVEKLRGFTAREVLRQELEEAFAADSAAKVREALVYLTNHGHLPEAGCRVELAQPCRDGAMVWTETDFSVLFDESGMPQGLLGHSRDISERRRTEQEIRHIRDRCWNSERLARAGVITISLAHELNQPLAAILCNAQAGLLLMARGNPDLEEIRDILENIVDDDKRAADVISSLRGILSRAESRREKTCVAQAVREIVTMLQSDIQEHQIEVDIANMADCAVMVDKAQIQQVLLNLVVNAIEALQHQPAGERRLAIAVECTDSKLQVAIRDSGPGIPDTQIGRILVEPFRTTKKHGLGIGLMICRSIVESHSGRIWSKNNPDRGVTFFFTLPLAEATAAGARTD